MSELGSFDYIVVGAGSAGCALAARLSEHASVSVALIEAGPDNRTWKIDMPAMVADLVTGTKYNWAYKTEAEPFIGNRVVDIARGRVLGGSSSINGMVFTRGEPADFDEWAADGCTGWAYKDVLPYFKRMETSTRGENRYRGGSGPLQVMVPPGKDKPINRAWMEAGREAGFAVVDDPNGATQEGFGPSEQSILKGVRSSTARAYLTEEVRHRPNLTILTGVEVDRLMMEGTRAAGVSGRRGGRAVTFRAGREIILSAGAANSPKILMLSGIGDGARLAGLGLPVARHLPGVGQNLQDHPDVAVHYTCKDAKASLRRLMRFPRNVLIGMQWFANHTGFAASNQFEAAAFVRTRPGLAKPNLKFEMLPLAIDPVSFKPYPMPSLEVHCALMCAESRGEIALRSANPNDAPVIRMNFLKEEVDRQSLREGVRLARKVLATRAFSAYAGDELEPGREVDSDAALDAWIDQRVMTSWHLAGSCKMGPGSDPMAVVGPDLKVHGVQGLRVADASIMPVVVSANTNAASIMIGDRAGDLVKG